MSKRLSLVLTAALLFVGSQTFLSCDLNDDEPGTAVPSLSGYWKSSYGDGFEISGTTFTAYDDAAKTVSFAGTVVNDPDFASNAAFLTLRITVSGTWGKTVGKYYVVHMKSYTGTTVQWASPYKSGGISEADTQAAAEAEFTIANGYYTYYGDYVKQ